MLASVKRASNFSYHGVLQSGTWTGAAEDHEHPCFHIATKHYSADGFRTCCMLTAESYSFIANIIVNGQKAAQRCHLTCRLET